ncbi:hypothetical protein IIB51_02145 [Patescibacteria group bacterium]|nr:hypothetical protein [Patescibacteria group bacterium]
MNYKRALLLSLLAYVISFIVGLLAALIFSVDFSGDEPIPQSLWYVGIIASVIIMASLTLWYFKSDTTRAGTLNGLAFGAVAVFFSAILDTLIFIPAALSGKGNELIAYYSEPFFWITLILVIVTTTLVGYLMGRKSGGDGAGKEEVRGEPEPLQKTFVPATEKPAESETVEPVSLGAPPGAPEVTPKVPTPPHTPPPPPPPTPTPPRLRHHHHLHKLLKHRRLLLSLQLKYRLLLSRLFHHLNQHRHRLIRHAHQHRTLQILT